MRYHRKRGDRDGMATCNRVFAEYASESGLARVPQISPDNCSISVVTLTPVQFMATVRRHHRSRPRSETDRPVLISYDDRLYVVDGNNRINKWLGSGEASERDAILIQAPAAPADASAPARR